MSLSIQIVLLLLCILSDKIVQAYITCGSDFPTQQTCYGTGAYCCGMYNDECCWETVYSYWWFWFIWVWIFFLIVVCSVCICVRRRRRLAAQPRYVIVEQQPTYGSVMPQQYGQMPTQYTGQTPGQYTGQAPTAPSYMEKPPPYNAVPSGRN